MRKGGGIAGQNIDSSAITLCIVYFPVGLCCMYGLGLMVMAYNGDHSPGLQLSFRLRISYSCSLFHLESPPAALRLTDPLLV